MLYRTLFVVALLATTACTTRTATTAPATAAAAAQESPQGIWPNVQSRVRRDPAQEARIDQMLARMTVEEKVAQIVQPDIASVTPEDMRKYKFGSILNGGNSAPGNNETAPAAEWLKLADAFWEASMDRPDGELKVPMIWGTDAVHGHANPRSRSSAMIAGAGHMKAFPKIPRSRVPTQANW
jgi:beta-glucosidase